MSFRKGAWKLILDDYKGKAENVNVVALYNLEKDLSEKTNLLKTNLETAQTLVSEFKQFLYAREIKPNAVKSRERKQATDEENKPKKKRKKARRKE